MATLYLIEQGAKIRRDSRRIVVEKDDNILLEVPEFKLERILIFGNVQITTQVIKFLLETGIETAFLTTHGKLVGKLTPIESKNIDLRLAQFRRYSDESFRVSISKQIMEGKIKNSKALLRKYQTNHPELDFSSGIDELDSLLDELSRKEKVSSIMGIEGRASAIYFSYFGKMFRKELVFETRNRRPPLDPINSLLSLGYTLVTNEIYSLISSIGLDPYIGFFHEIEYGRPSLALDILEEFRVPLIDRFTLELANKKILTQNDFELRDNKVLLKDESLKIYFSHYEKRMQECIQNPDDKSGINYRKLIYHQVRKFTQTIKEGIPYRPFLIR